jgi:hypothetical protein
VDVANYTVQFFLPSSRLVPAHGKPVTAAGFRAKANVVWSVKGQPIRRQFHVGDGTSIVGTADGVDVTIVDDTQLSPGAGYDGVEYQAIITVTKGTRGTHKQPVFYDLGAQLATPPATAPLEIPDDIGALAILVTAISNDPANPVINGSTAIIIDNGAVPVLTFDPFRNSDWLPLPPDALNITYFQSAMGGAVVSFGTFLGIDG